MLLAAISGDPIGEVLDVGCGAGRFTRLLAARARHVTGLDFSANTSIALRLLHERRLLRDPEVRSAWDTHAATDHYPSIPEVKRVAARVLPGALVHRHLL